MKLSVIVPAYNVETTLKRCIQSIIDQKIDDMEIIIINDGSRDNTLQIASDIADTHPSVRLINQENCGLSGARNTGIEASRGEYITFVDSDDWLASGTYSPLLNMLEQNPNTDIVEYSVEKDKGIKGKTTMLLNDGVYTDPRRYWLETKGYEHTYAWNKIFKRSMFFTDAHTPVRFPVGKVFEDVSLMTELLRYNPCILTTKHKGYIYEWNPMGITARAKGHELQQLLDAQLHAAKSLGINFLAQEQTDNIRRKVDAVETPLYLTLLNIQISVSRLCGTTPVMPSLKVGICSNAISPVILFKVFLLNTFGINTLCKVFSKL